MNPRRFTDPLGSKLPALERSIIKFRVMEISLVIFYTEELKRTILDLIQATDELRTALMERNAPPERVPKGTKNALKKALDALITDKAITAHEKREIVQLIDYRNYIAHEIHNLFVDLSADQLAHSMITHCKDKLKRYDYNALQRLQHFLDKLKESYRTHHYVMRARFDILLFESMERSLVEEMRRLRLKIDRLYSARQRDIAALNEELSLEGMELKDDGHPMHPLNRYEDGRLTRRGVEICYRLFDMGKSSMAVAHLTGLSLASTRRRRRMWTASGEINRVRVDIESCPRRKFYRPRD